MILHSAVAISSTIEPTGDCQTSTPRTDLFRLTCGICHIPRSPHNPDSESFSCRTGKSQALLSRCRGCRLISLIQALDRCTASLEAVRYLDPTPSLIATHGAVFPAATISIHLPLSDRLCARARRFLALTAWQWLAPLEPTLALSDATSFAVLHKSTSIS